jgi:hypothetical protein
MYAQPAYQSPEPIPLPARLFARDRPVADPAVTGTQRLAPLDPALQLQTLDAVPERARSAWLVAAGPTLQRSAGNRAVAALVDGLRGTKPRNGEPHRIAASVQRCGDVDPAACPCHADEAGAADRSEHGHDRAVVARSAASFAPTVQRELSADQAQSIARKLEDAMSGWGTDEDSIYSALSGRSAWDLRDIRAAFRALFRKDLDAELRDELNDEELARVTQMMPPVADESALAPAEAEAIKVDRARVTADRLRRAMAGWGTDEDAIFAALSGRSHEEIGEIKRQYLDMTGRYLETDLNDELSGEDLRRAINLIDVVGEYEKTGFSECTPAIREKIREFVPIARTHVQSAMRSLQPGWRALDPTVKTTFRRYFDPGNSGQIDDRFVRLGLYNFARIARYMDQGLEFDCNLASSSICGDGHKWCGEGDGNGRLYWTCFGDLHVCANAGWMRATDERRWSDIIHESTHNALLTTDRAYCNSTDWPGLTPYGTGAMSVLDEIPVIGKIFSLAGGGGDTLNNPDSYSHFAQES